MYIAIIILTSVIFLATLLYKIMKPSIARYFLPVILSALYGFLLFYLGFSISTALFYIFSALPVIILLFLVFKDNFDK